MKINYLALSFAIILGASFAAPHLVNADTSCTTTVNGVQVTGIVITTASGNVCSTTANQCQGATPGVTTCTTSAGARGTCDSSGTCQAGTQNPPGNNPPGDKVTLKNPLGDGATLDSFVVSLLQLVVKIGSVIIVLMIVYVGFLFVVARGDPAKITTARQALLWTVVGALILLGAVAIAKGIQATVQALSTGN